MMGKLSGRGVLVWLGLFFGIIFVTNFIFIALSVKTFSGEDEGDPYLQGSRYNVTLADRARQQRLGWQATIAARRLSDGAVGVDVAIAGPDGKPQSGVALEGELRHPADENRDRGLHFRETAPGNYRAELTGISAGNWDVQVKDGSGAPFEASRRLWVP